MKPEQRLITQVQQFLSSKHNIKIQIPRLSNLINSKINLKIWPTPQIQIPIRSSSSQQFHNASPSNQQQPVHENRYRQLISYIESLLQSSNLDLEAIDNFMTVFNKIINTDIDIMQKNQSIRSNSYKIKEKVLFRIEDITKKTDSLNANISKIHNKSDILSFIVIDIKNYLLSMKLIEEQYESVRAVQVHTSLKIDDIYTYEHSSEQDYHDHYEPLLEVLVRLRANMLNLQSAVKKCDRIQMPLKSVNLLANCKNLLTELKPFLIDDRCSFNRLIFYVVSQQSENMKAISGFYKNYLEYVKSLVYNVLKCVFLGHLFKSYYHQFSTTLEQERKKIVDTIVILASSNNGSNIKIDPFSQTKQSLNLSQQKIQKLSSNISDIKQIICYGQTTIMQDYLQQKICKKLNYLIQWQGQIKDIKNLLSNMQGIFDILQSIQQEGKSLVKVEQQIKKYIQFLNKDEGSAQAGSQGNKSMSKSMINTFEESPDENNKKIKVFRSAFLLIQQNNLTLSKLLQRISQSARNCRQAQLISGFFPSLQEKITKIRQQYLEMQTDLLNCYKDVLENQQAQQEQGIHYSKKVVDHVGNYLTEESANSEKGEVAQGSFFASMGGQILNEDEQCHEVKQLLGLIDKAEYKIRKAGGNKINEPSSSQKQPKQKNVNEMLILQQNKFKLQKYRRYLEWLLVMFEGSMDENILQSIIDKIDFNEQNVANIKKNVAKVQQLLSQIDKYEKQLKRIIKQIQTEKTQMLALAQQKRDVESTVICNKILKVARERLILYELINTIYSQCLEIYIGLKQQKPGQPPPTSFNIQQTGLTLFSKPQFSSVLSLYHSLNKVSVTTKLLHDSAIPAKTCNYINDELLDPFSSRLNAYAKLNESQMLNLVIRLEKAMQIQKDYKGSIVKWEQSLDNMMKDAKWDLNTMKQQSEDLSIMGEEINKIIELDKKQLVVHNLQQMKKIQKQCQEHIDLANQIMATEHLSELSIGKQYTNLKIKQIVVQLNRINAKQGVNQ